MRGGLRGSLELESDGGRGKASQYPGMEISLWRYLPGDTTAFAIRTAPDVDACRADAVLQPGEVFGVSEEYQGADGVTYLKLADGRGWAFDIDSSLAALCVREKLAPQRSLDAQDAHMLVGTWRYGSKGGKYQISLTEWGQLRFDEQPPSGRRAYGFLEPNDQWFLAKLNYHDGEPVGTIRLSYMPEQGTILSNFRSAGKTEWQPDLTSHKRRQVLPTVLENDGTAEDTEHFKENMNPTTEGAISRANNPLVSHNDAHSRLAIIQPDTGALSKSCPIVHGKHSEAEAVVLAARHADMMLQLLREAQRDRDLTQQRLSEVEAGNAQLRQILSTKDAKHRELEMERDMLLAQLKESRAQVEGLVAVCKDHRTQPVVHEERLYGQIPTPGPTGPAAQTRTSRHQSLGAEEHVAPVKVSVGRLSCQSAKSYDGIPAKTYEPMQTKSYDGVPCTRTAPSSPPTPVHPRIVKTVSQPIRIVQVPTPVRSGLRVASRERPRYSWQPCMSPSAERSGLRACSPTGC